MPIGLTNQEGVEMLNYALSTKSSEIIISVDDFDEQCSYYDKYTLLRALEEAENTKDAGDFEIERPVIQSVYQKPVTETERKLEELWKSIFGYVQIGINDDFFELGGDSLKAMTLVKKTHKLFNVELSIGELFKKSTIEELAKEIDLAVEIVKMTTSDHQTEKSQQIRI